MLWCKPELKKSSYPIGYPIAKCKSGSVENTDKNTRVREPLSPLVNSQNLTKPFKSYDLKGFLFFNLSKIFIITHFKGVQFGVLENFHFIVPLSLEKPLKSTCLLNEHLDLC